MAFIPADRVLETCNSPGTGQVTLLGPQTGYQSFSAGIGNGNSFYYGIADQNGPNWEVGYGTYSSSGNTWTRTTVLASSNAGSLVNFSSGIQNIWIDYPAGKALFVDLNGDVLPAIRNINGNASNVTGTVAISNGGTGQTSQQSAINALAGAVTSGYFLRGNGSNAVMSGIQAADVPTLNQNTTGSSGSCTGNAVTATTLQTPRTLTVGNTGKTFNGSSDLSWSLLEMGAAAVGQVTYFGMTPVAINRAAAALSLVGVSIDGSAGSVAWTGVSGRPTAVSAFTNDSGYITGINSSMVTTALGYTPYNSTNPSGYITSSGSAAQLGGLTKSQLWNNSGQNHGTYTSFGGVSDFGEWFVHQDAGVNDGPTSGYVGGGGTVQYYSRSVGLGNDYAYSSYAMQQAIARNVSQPYHWVRSREGGTWQGWTKVAAGYADSAGAVPWTGVTGRPTALSSFTNDSGYITSSGSISGSSGSCTGNSATATNSTQLGGTAAQYYVKGNGASAWGYRTTNIGGDSTQGLLSGFYDGSSMSNMPTSDWYHLMVNSHCNSYSGNQYEFHIATSFWDKSNFYMRSNSPGAVGAWRKLLHDGNYNSYAPTLTGGGASGTWGINITGTAAGLGIGQTWTDVTASRASATTYTNSTGKPIFVIIKSGLVGGSYNMYVNVTVGGVNLGQIAYGGYYDEGSAATAYFIVPPGTTYSATILNYQKWFELR